MLNVRRTASRPRGGKPHTRTCHGSLIRVLPQFEERYIILHRHTFPGVLKRIRQCKIRNYSIFLREGMLFSHFEYVGSDFDADMAAMGDTVTQEWWKLTAPMQEPLPTRKNGEWWASMELLLRVELDGIPSRRAQRSAYVAQVKDGAEQSLRAMVLPHVADAGRALKKGGIQNLTIYLKDRRLYAYVEWKRRAVNRDDLSGSAPHRHWLPPIEAQCEDDGRVWEPLQEVFHTD